MTKVATLLTVILLAACASEIIQPSYYLLRSDQELTTRTLSPNKEFAMGNVSIAPYIDQAGLVLEAPGGDMRPASYHLWAEPLYEGVRRFLLAEISISSGEDIILWNLNQEARRFDVHIDQMHGTRDGQAKLVAYWWLYDGETLASAHQFAHTRAISSDGYAALATAQEALLSELAAEIAGSLAVPD